MKNYKLSKQALIICFLINVFSSLCIAQSETRSARKLIDFQAELRYEFLEAGTYELRLLSYVNGNVTNYTVCIEGSDCINIPNRCNENYNTKNWMVSISKGCSITVFKSENGGPSSETMTLKGDHVNRNIMIWKSGGGFTLEVQASKIN